MNPQRPAKTAADYLVIAVSPALIMVIVHAVGFFLVDVFYRGAAAAGVRWVLFWFVLAVVLIARIGIQQGDGYAMGYGLALAAATWIYLATTQASALFGALLLAMVWFTAHQLTVNCTLVDEDADASGQGLLQSGFRRPRTIRHSTPLGARPGGLPKAAPVRVVATKPDKKSRPQIPGLWLIYFSLAALPLFGLGQLLLPAVDRAARHRGFVYLFLYLAAALGLLVTTSFLGLRRYLRQRHLVMPGNIALGWIKSGIFGAASVLCLALLFPRPGAGEAWVALRYQVNYQLHRASEYAARLQPPGTGSGRSGHQTTTSGQPPKPGDHSGANQEPHTGAGAAGDEPRNRTSGQNAPGGPTGNGHPEKPASASPPTTDAVARPVKIIFWLVASVLLGGLVFRCRVIVWMALLNVWTAIRNFIADWSNRFRSRPTALPQPAQSVTRPPFSHFKNPFLTGGDRLWSPEKLIVYTYEALQSWAQEPASTRGSPQTPREFCRQLGEDLPAANEALQQLAYLYSHVVYGAWLPAQYQPETLRPLWNLMSRPRPVQFPPEAMTHN